MLMELFMMKNQVFRHHTVKVEPGSPPPAAAASIPASGVLTDAEMVSLEHSTVSSEHSTILVAGSSRAMDVEES